MCTSKRVAASYVVVSATEERDKFATCVPGKNDGTTPHCTCEIATMMLLSMRRQRVPASDSGWGKRLEWTNSRIVAVCVRPHRGKNNGAGLE